MIEKRQVEVLDGSVGETELQEKMVSWFEGNREKWCVEKVERYHHGIEVLFQNGQRFAIDVRAYSSNPNVVRHATTEALLFEVKRRMDANSVGSTR